MEYVIFFGKVKEEDKGYVGVKGYNLAMLSQKGFKVPPGVIISKKVFDSFLSKKEIKSSVNEIFKCNENILEEKCHHVQKLIKSQVFSEEIAEEIHESYLSLSVDSEKLNVSSLLESDEVYIAVRSSYIEEKGFVPQLNQKTILHVKGKERLLKAILECYASNFSFEIISYKRENNLFEISSAVVIQRMIESEKAGVAYSMNLENNNHNEIRIDACFGLGEGISSGNIVPDIYIVDKSSLEIKNITVQDKKYEYVRDIETDTTIKQELESKSSKQVLLDKELIEVARIVKKIASSFEKEQKVEWAIKKDALYILQSKDLQTGEGKIENGSERVEMEIFEDKENENKKESDEYIDISEKDENELFEEIKKPRIKKEEEIQFHHFDEDTEFIMMDDKKQGENANMRLPEEKVEDGSREESILSGYKSDSSKNEAMLFNYSGLAKLNAGNILIYVSMALKEKLREKLLKYNQEPSDDLIKILDDLLQYENISDEDKIRKLDKSAKDFLVKMRYPEPEEVEMALRMI